MGMIDNRQQFIATVDNMSMAALIHDVISIQSNGMNIKTNFNYTKADVLEVLGDVPITNIEVKVWLEDYIKQNLESLSGNTE